MWCAWEDSNLHPIHYLVFRLGEGIEPSVPGSSPGACAIPQHAHVLGGPRENRTPQTASLQGKPVTPLLKPIIKRLHRSSLIMVRVVGFEPTRPFGPQLLRLGRLPIPSHPHGTKGRTRTFNYRDFYQDDHWAAALPLSNDFSVLLTLTSPTVHIVLCAGVATGVSTIPPPSHTLQALR